MLNVAVVRFPGSNCDLDTVRAAERVGANAFLVWHRDTSLRGADIVILPGGFSYGDYLRSGAIARFSPVMEAVSATRPMAARSSASATAFRSCARPTCCPARCCGTPG